MLGGLEQKIMDILWSTEKPLKPADIVKFLNKSHAYTTITTVLKRMNNKGIVTRKPVGNVYYYSAVQKKTEYAGICLDDLFVRLFDSFGDDVASAYKRAESRFSKK
jgi:predicted transcriptional regulator